MKIMSLVMIIMIYVSCTTSSYDADYDNNPLFTDTEKRIYLDVKSRRYPHAGYSSKRFFIFPAVQNISIDDPNFRMYSDFLYGALERAGYIIANHPDEAEIGILLYFGASLPLKLTNTQTVPVRGELHASAAYDPRISVHELPILKKDQQVAQVFNYHTQTQELYIYERVLSIAAIDMIRYRQADNLGGNPLIWQTQVKSSGSSNDLGVLIPHMIAGSQDFFGKNIEDPIKTYINLGDSRYRSLSHYIKVQKDYLRLHRIGEHIHERYFMRPPTSRPHRLRYYETPPSLAF